MFIKDILNSDDTSSQAAGPDRTQMNARDQNASHVASHALNVNIGFPPVGMAFEMQNPFQPIIAIVMGTVDSLNPTRDDFERLKYTVDHLMAGNCLNDAIQTIEVFLKKTPQMNPNIEISSIIDRIWEAISKSPNEEALPLYQKLINLCNAHPQILPNKGGRLKRERQQSNKLRTLTAQVGGERRQQIDKLTALANQVERDLKEGNDTGGAIRAIQSYLAENPFLDQGTRRRVIDQLICAVCEGVGVLVDQGFEQAALEQCSLLLGLWVGHPNVLEIKERAEKTLLAKGNVNVAKEEKIEVRQTLWHELDVLKKRVQESLLHDKLTGALRFVRAFCVKYAGRGNTAAEIGYLHQITDTICDYCQHKGSTNHAQVITCCDRLLKVGVRTSKLFITQAQVLIKEGLYVESLEAIDGALAVDPTDGIALYLKALNLYYLNRYAESEAICDIRLQRDPYSHAAWIKGEILAQRGQFQEALGSIALLLKIYPMDQGLIEKQRRYLDLSKK